jgi:integrase
MTNLIRLGTAETAKKALPNSFVYKVFAMPQDYDPDQRIAPNSREDDYFLMSLISLCTGARIGEVSALQAKHFTEESSFKSPSGQILWMTIEQSYQATSKTIGPPKSESYRTVPIAGLVVNLILNRLDELVRTWGNKYREAYLFTRSLESGGMPNQDRANQWLEDQYKKIFKVSVMPVDYSFHSLRRWFNTRALVLTGHNDYLVKRLMGHRDRANMSARYDTVSKDTYKLWIEELQPRLFGDPGDELNLPEFLRPVKTGELEMGFIRKYNSTIVVEDDD